MRLLAVIASLIFLALPSSAAIFADGQNLWLQTESPITGDPSPNPVPQAFLDEFPIDPDGWTVIQISSLYEDTTSTATVCAGPGPMDCYLIAPDGGVLTLIFDGVTYTAADWTAAAVVPFQLPGTSNGQDPTTQVIVPALGVDVAGVSASAPILDLPVGSGRFELVSVEHLVILTASTLPQPLDFVGLDIYSLDPKRGARLGFRDTTDDSIGYIYAPEPGMASMLGAGVLFIAATRRRRSEVAQ